jgi:[acyl-carrier-protein] S-malonyltransferase
MKKTCFAFSGQGAQAVGMGKDIADAFPSVRQLYTRANEALGMDLAKLCFEGPQDALNRTDTAQPALLVTSLAYLEATRLSADIPEFAVTAAAGLSLGEYTALAFAGAIGMEDAVRIVRKRGQFMQEACDAHPSGMASIIGLSRDKVEEACRAAQTLGVVNVANINAPGQIAISGDNAALAAAGEEAKKLGARKVIPLKVAGAFHSALMKPAEERLREELKKIGFHKPRTPVVSNVTGRYVTETPDIIECLGRQVTSPVLWEDSIKFLVSEGVQTYFEFGPGKVLVGLIGRVQEGLDLHTIGDAAAASTEAAHLKAMLLAT